MEAQKCRAALDRTEKYEPRERETYHQADSGLCQVYEEGDTDDRAHGGREMVSLGHMLTNQGCFGETQGRGRRNRRQTAWHRLSTRST